MPAKSKAQQKFFGMVLQAQRSKTNHPSTAVAKAAASMKRQDVKDFASTKLAGLKGHIMSNLKNRLKKNKGR